ncbi:MAG: insulinase family protein [Armatimonadetes bacterium]|nr:insulinase family protein [Armatimonadota bacterium]
MTALTLLLALAAPQLIRLDNGIPVIVDPDLGNGLVAIQALIRADDLNAEELGALELVVESLLVETEQFSVRRLRRLAWYVGGLVDVTLVGGVVCIEITTETSHFGPAVTLLSSVLTRPRFTPEGLAAAAVRIADTRSRAVRNPLSHPLRQFRAELGTGPRPVEGFGAESAAALHKRVFRPERVAIGVVGDVEPEAAARRLSGSLGSWMPEPASRTALRLRPAPVRLSGKMEAAMAAFRGPKLSDPRFPAWLTLAYAVGRGKGALVNGRFREELGWAYVTGITFSFRRDGTTAIAYALFQASGLEAKEIADRRRVLAQVLRGAGERLTDEQIERAKAFLIGQYAVGRGSGDGRPAAFSQGHSRASERAYWLAWWELSGTGFRMDERFPELVAGVSPSEVREAARRWLSEVKEYNGSSAGGLSPPDG